MARIEKAQLDISNDIDAATHNQYTLKNSSTPSAIVSFKEGMGVDEFQKAKSLIKEQYEGAKNAGKIFFADKNVDFKQIQITNKDLEYNEGRKFSRDNILALLGVPKPLLFSEDVNLANARAALDHFLSFTIAPLAQWYTDKLNLYILYSEDKSLKDTSIIYDDPSPKDREYNLKLAEAGYGTFLEVDEIRELLGYGLIGSPTKASTTQVVKRVLALYRIKGLSLAKEIEKDREEAISRVSKRFAIATKKHIERYVKALKIKGIHKNKSAAEDYLLNQEELEGLDKEFANDIYPDEKQVIEEGIKGVDKRFKVSLFAIMAGTIAMYAYTRSRKVASEVNRTLQNDAADVVARGLEQGKAPEEIKKDLLDKFTGEKESRVDRIVRTESINAYREGSWIGYKKLNVQRVQWDSLNDACETCAKNNGLIRRMGESFPSGDVAETAHPNCRCVTLPVEED